jgi:beta-lactam-binding protein with PASTA domain
MNFLKFLISKTFLKNLIAAVILIAVIIFGLKLYLNLYTHHNEYHLVPDLRKKSFEEAKKILEERKMNIVIVDTVEYNPKYPKYSVVEQNPRKDDKVKVGRKIYVKLNNSAFAKVSFPDILGKTKRQAIALLKASGLQPGKISRKPYFAEVVLYAIHQKDTLKAGQKIPKTSVVNLIIGDGKRPGDTGESGSGENNDSPDNFIQNTLDNVIGN